MKSIFLLISKSSSNIAVYFVYFLILFVIDKCTLLEFSSHLIARKRAATKMKKIGKEPSDENNEDNDSDLLSDINIGKEQTREQ